MSDPHSNLPFGSFSASEILFKGIYVQMEGGERLMRSVSPESQFAGLQAFLHCVWLHTAMPLYH